ncbi:MAG: AbrB/MazE/SpoVT family DNA-binding domain-containing protein [Chromatiales bacterium]|nr:AbrB/MazE/SpoVT family DNA-binding domain-containing protein [Chromatiales bacterium]
METTRLSSKGQVIIPKAIRDARQWEVGQELTVVETPEGVLLRPSAAFPETSLDEVAGSLRDRVQPRSDRQIAEALRRHARKRWRGRD